MNAIQGPHLRPVRLHPERSLLTRLLNNALAPLDRDPAGRSRREDACDPRAKDIRRATSRQGLLADWQIRRAEDVMRANLAHGLRLADVARAVGLSPSYFSRAFKSSFAVSFSDFMIAARIERAKSLLLMSDRTIADVALLCGLADQSHLTRLFTRSVGLPPRAWRCRLKSESAMATAICSRAEPLEAAGSPRLTTATAEDSPGLPAPATTIKSDTGRKTSFGFDESRDPHRLPATDGRKSHSIAQRGSTDA